MSDDRFKEVKNEIKLVIWDLDETFWQGTLSEGGATPVKAHLEMIRVLVDRGIMVSVCSKNDHAAARARLVELGVWDLFVFPHIEWTPKGAAIKSMVERMGLRPANVVFLDDNHLNLQEVAFFCPDMACIDAAGATDGTSEDLTALLDLPECRGKDDRSHKRLQQYKVMERREVEQQSTGLSNEDFLRQSGIELRIVTELDQRMDRVHELINRTNQLNFTKQRVHTEAEKDELTALLRVPGVHAGLIEVRDRYGDYGIVGFFCIRRRFSGTTVHHFAFSCRTLNMGVEQWVWHHLGRPEIEIVKPIANGLQEPAMVDWITQVEDFGAPAEAAMTRSVALVGGCDLQQVSFYCGARRTEFVNRQDDQGVIVRYDDAGFLLNPRDASLAQNWVLRRVAGHSLAEMQAADESFAQSDTIIVSLFFAFRSDNLFAHEGQGQPDRYLVTIPPKRLAALSRDPRIAVRMLRSLRHLKLPVEKRLDIMRAALSRVHGLKRSDAHLFVLGTSLRGGPAGRMMEERKAFNRMCRDFCATHHGAVFIDIDTVVPQKEFVDSDHYTRKGYHRIAEAINAAAPTMPPEDEPEALQPAV
ncbi:hypothetical protein RGQ15_01540 [Paracoccus sp. MBLB3053]|uniref:HAD-IIIC family phosphatase n=1 Tax=Paracoccus aurantius TaxID=3073814 RepID=A0ABU2HMJ0_9RHOB|nr:hypothetical protein [Paracoccus sp. MBLB3053]MDS9466255.1 hypothetical protein [Paracoccus sp. MBLB3053]